ncbi:DUF2919 domain-containing protein [Erwinia sp. 9145]|uniref:DUF2919 domain-containing protein n=1 Tax=Erwinia sp. 9145 TaxID=1500895 RepID=UPI000A40F53B|nr:DUF2919 domain-containing protein [Erwinia sp. 9145]
MMNQTATPDDYDAKGQLKLPLIFWLILLLQARTWVLFVAAGASRQQGAALLEMFYPDSTTFWVGLALGLPAAVGLLLTGYRQRLPRLWQAWRTVLALTLIATLVLQFLLNDDAFSPLSIVVSGCDLLALGYLWLSERLRACFDPALNGG